MLFKQHQCICALLHSKVSFSLYGRFLQNVIEDSERPVGSKISSNRAIVVVATYRSKADPGFACTPLH